jgi:hypothetical protein
VDAGEWWLSDVRAEISQGDAFADVPFSILVNPLTHLRYTEIGRGKSGWAETADPVVHKATQRAHALAALKMQLGIILSHDCEIDKPKDRHRILMAPIAPVAELPGDAQAAVLSQRHRALVPVGELRQLGQCFADLRGMTAVPAHLAKGNSRIASMTDGGRARLQGYLVSFLLRRVLPAA